MNCEGPEKYVRLMFDGGRRGSPLLLLLLLLCGGHPLFELTEEAKLEQEGKVGLWGLRQFVLDDADEAETEVANVDTERTL